MAQPLVIETKIEFISWGLWTRELTYKLTVGEQVTLMVAVIPENTDLEDAWDEIREHYQDAMDGIQAKVIKEVGYDPR